MKDRLRQFLETKGISSQRFAENMGIQPSAVSHILAGRNNPSYDIISKMLSKYPDISPRWLLLGEGCMQLQPAHTPISEQLPASRNFNSAASQANNPKSSDDDMQLFDFKASSDDVSQSREYTETQDSYVINRIQNTNILNDSGKTASQKVQADLSRLHPQVSSPHIERIVIFYENGTFKEYTKH